ncbi:response regulator [Modestobacter sp. NPDC049651]|uniref:response regulator n=1 Tax=unclassified Modestobacter TaxID=2643866 RepID=UPI0033EF38DB
MLTALVIDTEAAARRQVAGLLELGGWQVHEAADADEARWQNQLYDLDLVVTDSAVLGATGPELLRLFRAAGCTARFLVVAADPTDALRAEAAAAGALATLAEPVDVRLLLDLVERRADEPVEPNVVARIPAEIVDVEDLLDDDLDAELLDRLQEMYADALPDRMSAITRSVRDGDPVAVAWAAHTLAGPSGQLGHPEVATVCQAIAADARRGVLAHDLVAELTDLTRRPGEPARGRPAAAAARLDTGGLVAAVDAVAGRLTSS